MNFMARPMGRPPNPTPGTAPAVTVILPPLARLGEKLARLHDVARALGGAYGMTRRRRGKTDRVTFHFVSAEHAALFRARAIEIVGDLVEPGRSSDMRER
jgi:hypothetical protein